jgi:hypothetical protein
MKGFEATNLKNHSELLLVPPLKGTYFQPSRRNFGITDAMIYEGEEVILLRMLSNTNHSISLNSLETLEKAQLPLPSREKPWKLVFVMPTDVEGFTKPLKFKASGMGEGGALARSAEYWDPLVAQYITHITLEQLEGVQGELLKFTTVHF